MPTIYDPIPNNPFYSPQSNQIYTPQGNIIAGSGVAIDQFGYLNVASALGGTVTSVTAGTGLAGGVITVSGTLSLVPATNISLGGIKVGANLLIAPDGTLSALPPGTGTVNSITVGTGLIGGGPGPAVTINLAPASTTQFGGVVIGSGLNVVGGLVSLASATTGTVGGVQLATAAEVIAGTNNTKAITPAGLAAKVATTLVPGIVQLSDSVAVNDSTRAATQTAARTAYLAGTAAQVTANAALPKAGGTMTGVITFAPGQTFPGVAFPVATTSSLGVISVGSGLNVNVLGVLSAVNNGTVTAVTAGPGLGAPASGNIISTSGTLRLLPPTSDGLTLGGVKAGANINIAFDGTISVPGTNFIASNNPSAFNGYQWPIPNALPALPCPGSIGQVLTIANNVTGQLAWTNTGTLSSVVAGTGINVASTATTATVSLATIPTVIPGTFGATALIPTFNVNAYGQITSAGQANPYSPFNNATVVVPPNLVLDFTDNNLFWEWTLQQNTSIQAPLNCQSGQTGALLLRQNSITVYTATWHTNWKWANFTPYAGNPNLSGVDLIEFTVVSPIYIVVTNVVENIG
jgi:hypothetical protein